MEINHFFEIQLQWFYDNGIFYVNGRDIACFIAGISAGIIFVLFMLLVECLEEDWRKKHGHRRQNQDIF